MKKTLLIFGMLAIGLVLGLPHANAGAVTSPAIAGGIAAAARSGDSLLQDVHWRRYWHCHGPRWDRRCHGARRHWRHFHPRWRHHGRRDGWHRHRGHRDDDRGRRGRRGRD
jgi:hypothetical protein